MKKSALLILLVLIFTSCSNMQPEKTVAENSPETTAVTATTTAETATSVTETTTRRQVQSRTRTPRVTTASTTETVSDDWYISTDTIDFDMSEYNIPLTMGIDIEMPDMAALIFPLQAENPAENQLECIYLDIIRDTDIIFDGELVTVNFKIKDTIAANSVSDLSIFEPRFANRGTDSPEGFPEELIPNVVDGSVTIGSVPKQNQKNSENFSLYIDNVSGEIDETVSVSINVKNNPGFIAFYFAITYDKTVLEYISYEVGADFAAATAKM